MHIYRSRALGLVVLLLGACDRGQLPSDAVLTVSPDERKLLISEVQNAEGACLFDPGLFIDWPYVVNLTTEQGSPIRDASVRVYLDYAQNTFSGYPVMALYEDRNGNGVIDADTELISSANDEIAVFDTNDAGDQVFLLRANISCAWSGEVFVYVDGASATAHIDISNVSDPSEQSL